MKTRVLNLFSKQEYLYIAALTLLFFVTRLYNLLQLPVVVDEGNYIVWTLDGLLRKDYFITLTDGKPPLPTWISMAFVSFTPDTMLYGLRLSSVFSGLIGAIGMFILSFILFGKRTAFITTLLYILTPFILFYDRLGVVDSLTNAISFFILIGSILLVKKRTWKNTILFGIICGIALLIKQNVWTSIIMCLTAPLLIYPEYKKINLFVIAAGRFYLLFAVGILIAQGMFQIQLLSPYAEAMALVKSRNVSFFYPFSYFFSDPMAILHRVPARIATLLHMTGWIGILFTGVGFYKLWKKDVMLSVYLLIWFLVPFFFILLLLEHYFPRYIIFHASILILMAGYAIGTVKNNKYAGGLTVLLVLVFCYFNYAILFDYRKLDFPERETAQYITGIGSGYGMTEIANFIQEKAQHKKVLVVGEGSFGVGSHIIRSALPMELKNIEVTGPWPFDKKTLQQYQPLLQDTQVYVLLNFESVETVPPDWPLKLIKEYKKDYAPGYAYFRLYELTP